MSSLSLTSFQRLRKTLSQPAKNKNIGERRCCLALTLQIHKVTLPFSTAGALGPSVVSLTTNKLLSSSPRHIGSLLVNANMFGPSIKKHSCLQTLRACKRACEGSDPRNDFRLFRVNRSDPAPCLLSNPHHVALEFHTAVLWTRGNFEVFPHRAVERNLAKIPQVSTREVGFHMVENLK